MLLLIIHIEAYDCDEIYPNLMLNFRSGIITSVHVIASYLLHQLAPMIVMQGTLVTTRRCLALSNLPAEEFNRR